MTGKWSEGSDFDRSAKLEFWLCTGFAGVACGSTFLFGLLFATYGPSVTDLKGIELWIGLGITLLSTTGLAYTWRNFRRGPRTLASLENKAETLRKERLRAIDQLLAQRAPRQRIPKGFQGAQLTPKYVTALGAMVIGLFPGSLVGGYFIFGDLNLKEVTFFPLLYGLLSAVVLVFGSILWVAFLWLRISERRLRRKILRDGRLVDGTVVTVKSCGEWENALFSPPEGVGTQFRALFEFPWEGGARQAHQFVYENDENTSFRSLPPGTPVRLLVRPTGPRQVIWVEATFLPDPLRNITAS